MRIEVFTIDMDASPDLRRYAESRVWLAVQRVARRLSWVGVTLSGVREAAPARVVCQVDAWVRGVGLLTVRHTDTNPYLGIDCATVRLQQALQRHLRMPRLPGHRPTTRRRVGAGRARDAGQQPAQPRLAVVLRPRAHDRHLALRPWLNTRYGIDRVQSVTLSQADWAALAEPSDPSAAGMDRVLERLALAKLCRPELLVVLGYRRSEDDSPAGTDSKRAVEQIVRRIRALDLGIETVGVWADEQWSAEGRVFESEELAAQLPMSASTSDTAAELSDAARPVEAAQSNPHWEHEDGRSSHVVRHGREWTAQRAPEERERQAPRRGDAAVPGFRPDLAGVAADTDR